MIGKCSICLLLMLCFACSSVSAATYWDLSLERHLENSNLPETQNQTDTSDEYVKDIRMGYFYAVVPGFVVHGAGNMYGGRIGTGLTLFSLEVISVIGFTAAELQGWMGNSYGDDDKYAVIKVGSIILFFGTWIYDILTVDTAIKTKHERKRIEISFLKSADRNFEKRYTLMLMNLSIDL